jgi:hypothetical protein
VEAAYQSLEAVIVPKYHTKKRAGVSTEGTDSSLLGALTLLPSTRLVTRSEDDFGQGEIVKLDRGNDLVVP